jgi:peptide deformylase
MKDDVSQLRIINYPDPRLRRKSTPVTAFDAGLKALADRMFELLAEARGVGLAAPQVGINQRLFIMNLTGEPDSRRVYVNPELVDLEGASEAEEGCLSIPGVSVTIRRAVRARIRALDVLGRPFEEDAENLPCRCWQHETDHLNGVLITDRMGPADKIATRRLLQELEAEARA